VLPFYVKIGPGKPIYEQLVSAVRRALVSNTLKAGERFPSVREISKALSINPNTVQKAISELVREGFLEVHPGVGTVVANPQKTPSAGEVEAIREQLEELIVTARSV
jgi:GntR family transcriptional regulator